VLLEVFLLFEAFEPVVGLVAGADVPVTFDGSIE
jgi:hypothetical protein